jgi:hypothetical protein
MAYTIKGLAKANECESYDIYSLANLWDYWLTCNVCDRHSINDFKRLRKADRKEILNFLHSEPAYTKLYNHIINNIF